MAFDEKALRELGIQMPVLGDLYEGELGLLGVQ
jgi:hypothetical protein